MGARSADTHKKSESQTRFQLQNHFSESVMQPSHNSLKSLKLANPVPGNMRASVIKHAQTRPNLKRQIFRWLDQAKPRPIDSPKQLNLI
jgi:hypothetical protein